MSIQLRKVQHDDHRRRAITAQPGVAAGQSRAETGSSRQSPPAEEPTVERPIASAVIHLLGACTLLGLAGVIGLIAVRRSDSRLGIRPVPRRAR
jgi:hypothetical protein